MLYGSDTRSPGIREHREGYDNIRVRMGGKIFYTITADEPHASDYGQNTLPQNYMAVKLSVSQLVTDMPVL